MFRNVPSAEDRTSIGHQSSCLTNISAVVLYKSLGTTVHVLNNVYKKRPQKRVLQSPTWKNSDPIKSSQNSWKKHLRNTPLIPYLHSYCKKKKKSKSIPCFYSEETNHTCKGSACTVSSTGVKGEFDYTLF